MELKKLKITCLAFLCLNICSLALTPASPTTQLRYIALGATTASLLIQPVASTTNPISIPLDVQNQTTTINVASLATGWYVFALICDGQVQQGLYFLKN